VNASTNHNFSYSYLWHLFFIPIHKGPSSPHICHLLSSHLWYRYLEIEKCCTFYCAALLFPSWLMYPNNSFKAFIHFLEQGQFVMQFILEIFLIFWKTFIRKEIFWVMFISFSFLIDVNRQNSFFLWDAHKLVLILQQKLEK
jgi:hypothetical protein